MHACTDTHTQTHGDTGRQTDRQTQTHTLTRRDIQTHTHGHTRTHGHTDRQTDRQTDTHTSTHTPAHGHTDTLTQKQVYHTHMHIFTCTLMHTILYLHLMIRGCYTIDSIRASSRLHPFHTLMYEQFQQNSTRSITANYVTHTYIN